MQVYAGRWQAGGLLRDVAVKVCAFTDNKQREAFHHEVATLAGLGNQPRVIKMLGFAAVEHIGGALVLEQAQGVPYCALQDPRSDFFVSVHENLLVVAATFVLL